MTLADVVSRGYREVTAFLKRQKRAVVFASTLATAVAGFQCSPPPRAAGSGSSGQGRAEECYTDRDCEGNAICENNHCAEEQRIIKETTDDTGQAYFTDQGTGEEVIVRVEDEQTKAPLPGREVIFFDGTGYEAFLATDPTEEYIHSLMVFPHNSLHVLQQCRKEREYCINQIVEEGETLRAFVSFMEGHYERQFHYKRTMSRDDRVLANKVGFWIFNTVTGKALGALMTSIKAAEVLKESAEQIRDDVVHKYQDKITGVIPNHPRWDVYVKTGRQQIRKSARVLEGGVNLYLPSNIPNVKDLKVEVINDRVQLSWESIDGRSYGMQPNAVVPPEDLTIYEGPTTTFDHLFKYLVSDTSGRTIVEEEVGTKRFVEIRNVRSGEYRARVNVRDEVGNESEAETPFTILSCGGRVGSRYEQCGINGRGQQEMECRNGRMENVGACNDPDGCVDGMREERPCADQDVQQRECTYGSWTAYSPCRITRCQEGQVEVENCGLNNTGTREVRCERGAVIYDQCDDDNVCINGSFVDIGQTCGRNNQGEMYRECADGRWSESRCREQDQCINGQVNENVCGNGERQYQQCEGGRWSAWTICGGCIEGMEEDRACGSDVGECARGLEHLVCDANRGAWNPGGCQGAVGPDAEICENARDEDCDGLINNGCPVLGQEGEGEGGGEGEGEPGLHGRLAGVSLEWSRESELDLHVYTPNCHAYPQGGQDCGQEYIFLSTIDADGSHGCVGAPVPLRLEDVSLIPDAAPEGEYVFNVRLVQRHCPEDREEDTIPYVLRIALAEQPWEIQLRGELQQQCTPQETAAEQPSVSACQQTYRFDHER